MRFRFRAREPDKVNCADGYVFHSWRFELGILMRYYNCHRCNVQCIIGRTTVGPAQVLAPETLI